MKILIPTHIFSDVMPNGLLVVTWNLVNGLARRGVKVYVVSNRTYLHTKKLHPNIKLYTINNCQRSITYDKRCLFYSWLFCLPLMIFKKIDFVFILDTLYTPFSWLKISKVIKRAIKLWDYQNPKLRKDLFHDRKRKLAEENFIVKKFFLGKVIDFFIEKFFKMIEKKPHYKKADIIFYQTYQIKDKLPKNSFYLPNAVDVKDIKRLTKKKNQKFIYLFVGHIAKRKGIEYLLKAFNKLAEKYENMQLWLLGQGAPDTIENLKKQYTAKNIKWFGKIWRDRLPDFFQAANVFVLPSLGETMPNAVLEAMAYELPVITTNGGGIVDFFTDGKTGLLVEPAEVKGLFEAMEFMYLDPQAAAAMARDGRDYVEKNLSVEKIADIVIKTLNKYAH